MKKILNLIFNLIKSIRPLQWLKNLALYAPLLFSGFFFHNPVDGQPFFIIVSEAFLLFCILTSSMYLINDVIDREADRRHPVKKRRPIASGKLPVSAALFSAAAGIASVLFLSAGFSPFFRVLIISYAILQIIYSLSLKHQPILDVLAIAAGFLIRIYAGAVVVNLHMSVWFLLTVVSASLFLAVGKRQSEQTLMKNKNPSATRKTLGKYSPRLLDVYTSMFANATWLTYAIYTFEIQASYFSEPAFERFPQLYVLLPRALQSQKLLMLTVPLVIFGVMRYLALVYEDNKGESPERVLINDKTLLSTVFVFAVVTMVIIYL